MKLRLTLSNSEKQEACSFLVSNFARFDGHLQFNVYYLSDCDDISLALLDCGIKHKFVEPGKFYIYDYKKDFSLTPG